MTPSRLLRELIASDRLQEARELCERQRHVEPGGSFYDFWLQRLDGKTGARDQAGDFRFQPRWRELRAEFDRNPYQVGPKRAPEGDLREALDEVKRAIPFKGDIYLPTERIPEPEQLTGLQRVLDLVTPENRRASKARFDALRRHMGRTGKRRVFVIGNGPSLKRTDLRLLRGEITIGFNGIFLHEDFVPTIYVVEDHLVAEDRVREIHAYDCPVKIFPSYLGYVIEPQPNTIYLNHVSRISYPVDADFTVDAGDLSYTGGTVTYTGLQIAASLGFEEIILVGVDASYSVHNVDRSTAYGTGVLTSKSDDVNHFDPRYFGSGYRWHDPNVNVMLQAYRKARDYASKAGIRIHNATIGGELEVFPRVDFHQLFPDHVAYPRCGIIDFTSVNKLSATGAIKKSLFAGWSRASLLHVHSDKIANICAFQSVENDQYPVGTNEESIWPALRAAIEFAPQVLYVRPTLDRPQMTAFQLLLPLLLDRPYVIHYMDDWIEKARLTSAPEVARFQKSLMSSFFSCGSAVLSICDKMSKMLVDRYGTLESRTHAIHNFIRSEAPARRTATQSAGVRTIRYFGGIEPDMGLKTLVSVARQVDSINERKALPFELRFEITTSQYSIKRCGAQFESFKSTIVGEQVPDEAEYYQALANSDLNLICYNFDERTLAYVSHSMANKLPDLIASGAPFLAIGHPGVATTELLAEHGFPFMLDREDFDLEPMLREIFFPSPEILEKYVAATGLLKQEFGEEKNRFAFHRILRRVAEDDSQSWRSLDGALPLLTRFLATLDPQPAYLGDLRCLVSLAAMDRAFIDAVLARVRGHGLRWSVRGMHKELIRKIKSPADLQQAPQGLQAEAVAFLICGLGHERYEDVCGIVRGWLSTDAVNGAEIERGQESCYA